jgi:hypothetical protein
MDPILIPEDRQVDHNIGLGPCSPEALNNGPFVPQLSFMGALMLY